MFNFLDCTQPAFKTIVLGKINTACTALSDLFTDHVAVTQNLPILKRLGQIFSFVGSVCLWVYALVMAV